MSLVRITKRRKRMFGPTTYEIEPIKYDGPWILPEGTVLEVKGKLDPPTKLATGGRVRTGDPTESVD